MPTSDTGATISGHPRRDDDTTLLARLVADALKDSVAELRRGDEMMMSQFTTAFREEISALREGEEYRLARLEKAIATLKPAEIWADPTTSFWTAYKKVADEFDTDLASKYAGDLSTSLVFAGLFSAITSAFIVQILPGLQPNPADLTNALLLRILQQNTSFGGTDPPTPISNVRAGAVAAQSILFTSLSATLFVAFVAVFGRQWIHRYTQVTGWANIADRGKERHAKLMGLRKWGLYLIMESLPVMLQFSLFLFGAALVVYLWDLDVSVAEVVLVVTSVGVVLYICIAAAAAVCCGYPFQTPLSGLILKILPWAKKSTTLAFIWLRRWWMRRVTAPLLPIRWVTGGGCLTSSLGLLFRRFAGGMNTQNDAGEDPHNDYPMTLSNPAFWRYYPLFTCPIPEDIAVSAGFWLLENSTDSSTASAVAVIISESQLPSCSVPTVALVRLHDAYTEGFRAPDFNGSVRLRALHSATAYYVLYHAQLVRTTFESLEIEVERLPPDLPPDLFLHLHNDEWNGSSVFEHLLRIEDRSEPGTSARFLSYIAPYWFLGDSDATVGSRPSRLQALYELVEVLKKSQALNLATLTECFLCVGVALDFPIHPEDLIRVDKSDYFELTFKMVVEYIHGMVLYRGRRHRYAKPALEILLTLVKETTFPLVDSVWINGLLKAAVGGNMDDGTFTSLLRLSARRKEEDAAADTETPPDPGFVYVREGDTDQRSPGGAAPHEVIPTPEYILFSKILKNVQTCIEREGGWQDEAVYGGLIAIRDIPRPGSFLPEVEFLRTLSKAMEKEKDKTFHVRKAAYDVILVAREWWLRSPDLRQTLEDLDFPRQLHSVVIETGRSDHQVSFLKIMEILSEDRYWHPYLRKTMDIWLPFHHEGRDRVLRILTTVGELLPLEYDGSNRPSFDKPLEKVVEDEWAGVPGRHPMDLTADRLEPLAEVTKQFKGLFFTESNRKAVLAAVERVIPSLERRRDDDYEGPGEDVRGIVDDLLEKLRTPMQSTSQD